MILWFTGISGAGKTTIGSYFFKKFKNKNKNTIMIDGDEFRNVFSNDLKYTLKDRNKNAERITSLVKYISNQNINIIVAANLTSKKYRDWCKKNLKNYINVYINANISSLIKRDYKNLYKKALNKKIKNVVGVDIPAIIPKKVDIIIQNDNTKKNFLNKIKKIEEYIKEKKIKVF